MEGNGLDLYTFGFWSRRATCVYHSPEWETWTARGYITATVTNGIAVVVPDDCKANRVYRP